MVDALTHPSDANIFRISCIVSRRSALRWHGIEKGSHIETSSASAFRQQKLPLVLFGSITFPDRHVDAANGGVLARL